MIFLSCYKIIENRLFKTTWPAQAAWTQSSNVVLTICFLFPQGNRSVLPNCASLRVVPFALVSITEGGERRLMSPDVLTLRSGAVRVQRGSGRLVIPVMKFWRGPAVGTRAWVTVGIIQGTYL